MSRRAARLPNALPDPAGRFARDLIALAAAPVPDRPLAIAVSGGPDSMALLRLAATAFPAGVIAATVDHRLRAAAADEAAMVARWCRAQDIPHATLAPATPPSGASIQAQARHVRYALLGDWALTAGACALATAHHANDQAETFLMRAARGSGPAGLSGIRPRWDYDPGQWETSTLLRTPAKAGAQLGNLAGVSHDLPHWAPALAGVRPARTDTLLPIVRPLLGWRRHDLLAIAADLPFVDDPSNSDPRHDRTAARALLAQGHLDPAALAAAAAHCREVDAALGETVDWLWRTRRLPADPGEVRLDPTDLPRELCRRLARRAIGVVRAHAPCEGRWSDSANIEPLLDALTAGKAATQAGVFVTVRGPLWHFRPAPPRRSV